MKNDPIEDQVPDEKQDKSFQSDTQKVIRRHLENEDDTISEDDIRNVRVGMSPDTDSLAKAAEKLEDEVKDIDEKKDDDSKDPNEEPVTPWDVIDR